MLDVLRNTKHAAELGLERWRLRRFYTQPHSNLDVECHVREATDWLKRAQDHGEDRGVSYGAKFGEGFQDSYPETTGYIIPTALALADHTGDPEWEARAGPTYASSSFSTSKICRPR